MLGQDERLNDDVRLLLWRSMQFIESPLGIHGQMKDFVPFAIGNSELNFLSRHTWTSVSTDCPHCQAAVNRPLPKYIDYYSAVRDGMSEEFLTKIEKGKSGELRVMCDVCKNRFQIQYTYSNNGEPGDVRAVK